MHYLKQHKIYRMCETNYKRLGDQDHIVWLLQLDGATAGFRSELDDKRALWAIPTKQPNIYRNVNKWIIHYYVGIVCQDSIRKPLIGQMEIGQMEIGQMEWINELGLDDVALVMILGLNTMYVILIWGNFNYLTMVLHI